jgi:hypothetical protein
MGLSINIELSDNDLDHFQEVLRRAHQTAGSKSSREITDAASGAAGGRAWQATPRSSSPSAWPSSMR